MNTKRMLLGAALATAVLALSLALFAAAPAQAAGSGTGDDHAAHHDPTKHFNWTDLNYGGKVVEETGEDMSPPMILMFVNFGVVLIILGWKAWPPIKRYVRKRHETIKDALEEAARLREEAQEQLDAQTEKLAKAEKEMDQMIIEMREAAEEDKKRILAEAKERAEALERDAQERIAGEIARARRELEAEVIAVAIAAAEKLIRDKTTEGDQSRLVETFINDVQAQASEAPAADA